MSVYLNPSSSLGFHRPLTQLVKRALTISNPNTQPVAFKVKTTAPKLYCVRPNSGRIEPGQSVEVSVMLQALKEEPPLTAKCKDKFLIQSTVITPEKESKSLQEIWAVPEGATDDTNKVHQQKLRVVYLPPEGERLDEEDEGTIQQQSSMNGVEKDAAPIQSSTSVPDARPSRYETVQSRPETNGHPMPDFDADSSFQQQPEQYAESHDEPQAPPPVSVFVQPPGSEKLAVVPEPEPEPAPAAPIVTREVSAPAPIPMPTPSSTLSEELKEARAEIDRLRSLLAAAAPPPELRRRSRAISDDGTVVSGTDVGTIIDEPPLSQEGVPLQVVVIIALGVFVMTYLFF
ncbi:phosphatidylinositol-binding protein scs2 [Stygiomarasmius scandens]|uniref:Phosphatidylinositol-binding protein scs2 n=1 Tax=Marasmiellus scandens TaxID=2682957 RepID=A0ABR1K1A0_9AGAR